MFCDVLYDTIIILDCVVFSGKMINTFWPALVLVPMGLSCHQSGIGTSTKPIFISLLKKNVLGTMASGLYH